MLQRIPGPFGHCNLDCFGAAEPTPCLFVACRGWGDGERMVSCWGEEQPLQGCLLALHGAAEVWAGSLPPV